MKILCFPRGLILIPAFIFIFNSLVHSEHPDSSLTKIEERTIFFKKAASYFNINPKFLKSIVFVERTLNYDWKDDALDIILANAGKNSSIGFCQVKLKTAYWIEKTLSDSSDIFFPGQIYNNILSVSKSPSELIHKLRNDSLNILYAASYIRIIQSYWEKSGFSICNCPDIIGTIYSTGLFFRDGGIREPNSNPKSNFFGSKVLKVLHLFR
ncbi:MAG: hypothetical protein GF313_06955 [Caldithrix sp.]|nr:hypothetical protein [Caldithrix sp.]